MLHRPWLQAGRAPGRLQALCRFVKRVPRAWTRPLGTLKWGNERARVVTGWPRPGEATLDEVTVQKTDAQPMPESRVPHSPPQPRRIDRLPVFVHKKRKKERPGKGLTERERRRQPNGNMATAQTRTKPEEVSDIVVRGASACAF